MILTTGNAVHYLLARRLIDSEAVVDGGIVAVDASRRNRNIKVRWRDGPGLFLKQVQSADAQDATALGREAACCDLPRRHADLAPLAALMPQVRFYDRATNILAVELIDEGESLYAFHKRTRAFRTDIGSALGAALAQLHSVRIADVLDSSQLSSLFGLAPPWILSTPAMAPAALGSSVSPANRELLRLIQRHSGFAEVLGTIRDEWRPDSLIHGDMKWDNCLVARTDAAEGDVQVRFVDWELADVGDPCWDVGALFQAYLSEWIFSVPEGPATSTEHLARSASTPLESLQPAMHALWERYAFDREIPAEQRAAVLQHCVRCAGARMVQTAYESLNFAQVLSPRVALLLQVSLNVLTRPREAATQLLGIG